MRDSNELYRKVSHLAQGHALSAGCLWPFLSPPARGAAGSSDDRRASGCCRCVTACAEHQQSPINCSRFGESLPTWISAARLVARQGVMIPRSTTQRRTTMTTFRKFATRTAVAAAAALCGAGAVLADGYATPRAAYERPADWTGLYGGVNAGWKTTNFDWAFAPPIAAAPHQAYSLQSDDGVVGLHAGYQHQFGTIVLGVEANYEFNWTDWAKEPGFGIAATKESDARMKRLLTVGPRFGFTHYNWLFYGTGGWAFGQIETRSTILATGLGADSAGTVDHNGWFAGGGIEVMLSKNTFVGIEYKHVALETERHCSGPPIGTCLGAGGGFADRNINADVDIVTARLSLKWGREDRVVPLK
jgi:outer membrane immunogenic protein